MNTNKLYTHRFGLNLAAAKAGTLPPSVDHGYDVCVCGAIRGEHVGQNDTCPAARADSTETFRIRPPVSIVPVRTLAVLQFLQSMNIPFDKPVTLIFEAEKPKVEPRPQPRKECTCPDCMEPGLR